MIDFSRCCKKTKNGSRFQNDVGGDFGGCSINLIEKGAEEEVIRDF
jgi:hypothetical protein